MDNESITLIEPRASRDFVETAFVKDIISRTMNYIKAGFPIHLRGISGTGKTTLALRIAESLGRPLVMIHGDEEMTTTNLVGGETGYHVRKLRDNFIHSVLKVEEDASKRWSDNRLTLAVENGYTLIYDEFTRSRPEANNILLSILQEGILDVPGQRDGESYVKVHPQFTAIFTSNPEEYAGVHRSQDALRDRMITLDLQTFDEESEIAIASMKSRLPKSEVAKIVKVVRNLRDSGQYEFSPTVRACIMIAKSVAVASRKVQISSHDIIFKSICHDILTSETSRIGSLSTSAKVRKIVTEAINKYCGNGTGGRGIKKVNKEVGS
ncbi:MAG: gas vesicle protein GvpN [Pseudomonadota bacterium]